MDLSRLNDYLPKSKEHYEKLQAMERKMVKEAKREKGEIRRAMTATAQDMVNIRKTMLDRSELIDAMRKRLERRVKESKELVAGAHKFGKFEEAKSLEDLNLRALEVNPVSMTEELRLKAERSEERLRNRTPVPTEPSLDPPSIVISPTVIGSKNKYEGPISMRN